MELLRQRIEEESVKPAAKPSFWRTWKFKLATKMALAAAEHFSLDVLIEANECIGEIKLTGDDIMTEAVIWHDNKQKRQLLLAIHLAESVYMGVKESHGANLLDIRLSYSLTRQ